MMSCHGEAPATQVQNKRFSDCICFFSNVWCIHDGSDLAAGSWTCKAHATAVYTGRLMDLQMTCTCPFALCLMHNASTDSPQAAFD